MVEEDLSEDTEITLGTGKMLFLFFALVALCAVFFGMGFKVGRNSVKGNDFTQAVMANVNGGSQSSGAKPSATPDMSFYKAVGQNNPDPQLPAANTSQPASQATFLLAYQRKPDAAGGSDRGFSADVDCRRTVCAHADQLAKLANRL